MEGPSATLALVLAETAAGGVALLWLGGLWGAVKRGFFILTGAVVLGCALLATAASASAVPGPVSGDARLAVLLSTVPCVLLGLSLAALILRADGLARVLGWAAIPASLATLVGFAAVAPSFPAATLQLLAGAAFLGAVTDGLLLGHWYLTDRRLSREHIKRFSLLLIAAVALEIVALALFGFVGGPADPGSFSVILGVSGLTTWIALGMVACTGLIAFMIRGTLRGDRARAVQAATGFFYLAVITAFTAEMAAKIGFLG